MQINLSPQRRDDRLTLVRKGDVLVINGREYDFSPLGDGAILPRTAVDCDFLVSDVQRRQGELHITLILPHGRTAPERTRFPLPIVDPPDGEVVLPPFDEEDGTPNA